ncbi:putative quinol monooxygenase [Leekyejoonella antrihumi]|uniref:ABM domain-containing protein n=1 Tax=Leekyejoonella antrihumi TaxID=1660198 RepID=A0A563E619_9MICO|nr:hypothetical protein FGL98_05710 [Leekyejoonella antrihumi]
MDGGRAQRTMWPLHREIRFRVRFEGAWPAHTSHSTVWGDCPRLTRPDCPGRRVEPGSEARGEMDRCAGLVRVSTFCARPGQTAALLAAAADNVRAARQASGCLSAQVCTAPGDPRTVLVISRWESESAVRAFLNWHERLAHGAVSPYAVGRPQSVHYPVVACDE